MERFVVTFTYRPGHSYMEGIEAVSLEHAVHRVNMFMSNKLNRASSVTIALANSDVVHYAQPWEDLDTTG